MEKILVVEDDRAVLLGLEDNLKDAGYEVITATDGEKGLDKAQKERPDLVILDLQLPKLSGYEVCKMLRDAGSSVPIIMLTVRAREIDKVMGLDLGADDYLTKPFSLKELLSRVKAILRRGKKISKVGEKYKFSDIEIDFTQHLVKRKDQELDISPREFNLLRFFIENEGRALSRDAILNGVWGTEVVVVDRTIDRFINSLRQKIEKDPRRPRHILTVWAMGYKFKK